MAEMTMVQAAAIRSQLNRIEDGVRVLNEKLQIKEQLNRIESLLEELKNIQSLPEDASAIAERIAELNNALESSLSESTPEKE